VFLTIKLGDFIPFLEELMRAMLVELRGMLDEFEAAYFSDGYLQLRLQISPSHLIVARRRSRGQIGVGRNPAEGDGLTARTMRLPRWSGRVVKCRGERTDPMAIEINGMAHVILTVSRFDIAREFYRRLLPEFGMKVVSDGDRFFYCVGARTAIGIEPCDPALAGERFVQQRVGLHHLCLRARSRQDVDKCAALVSEMGATIVRGPAEDTWAPGYYSVLFEDPDGIRIEVNFVPGAGLLAEGAQFRPGPPNIG